MRSMGQVRLLVQVAAAAVLCGGLLHADTLILKNGTDWQNVSASPEGQYVMAVARFKQLVGMGDSAGAMAELGRLKAERPELAGGDFDLFVAAELLYAEGKWVEAVRKYEELLTGYPSSWLYETAMEREFSVGQSFVNGEKRPVLKVLKLSAFDEGETILRRIADRAGEAPIAQRSLVTLARGYSKKGDHLDAYEVWSEISSRWPTGEMGRTALLEMAQSLHSAYRSPDYDPTSLASARTYYRNYRLRYPEMAVDNDIEEKLKLIDEQLAYKQYAIGEYYDRTGSVDAAKLYYDEVIRNWPDTAAAEMAQARILAWGSGLTEIVPGESKKLGRRLFKAGNVVVDSWFGLGFLSGNRK
ncbi:MAG: outer membrane protein assembly factor BamD [Phycisphaerae bacterium]|nr:outer membrane protein assembly factor BamD [Phycisphaerae bacterium]